MMQLIIDMRYSLTVFLETRSMLWVPYKIQYHFCMQGVGGVMAQNNAGSVVSICRTDYPGTESETVPTVLEAGETQALTVPDASNSYVWEGSWNIHSC